MRQRQFESVTSGMEEQIERLQAMLGDQNVWDGPKELVPFPIPEPSPVANSALSSDPEDDEKILSFDHRVGGRLEQIIGPAEGHQMINFPCYELQIGQEAPEGEAFCPLPALAAYPYNFISAATRARVVNEFFAKGNLYERPWDFFYLYPPKSISPKAIVLVPSRQVEHFLATINTKLNTRLKIPDDTARTGFLIDFPKDGTPRPRYLGHTDESEMAAGFKQAVPSFSYRPNGEPGVGCEPTKESLDAFKKKIELLLEVEKNKKAETKEKKKAERFAKQQAWNRSTKRVQRYLGIREVRPSHRDAVEAARGSLKGSGLKWLNYNQAVQAATAGVTGPETIDMEKPVPFIQEDSVVFICVDVESFERNHNFITEIGIATLDTADITGKAPGVGGTNWMNMIRARHFRVKEYGHLKNIDFVHGCPEAFRFGESEWISIKDAPHEISKCFKPPYSKSGAGRTEAVSVEEWNASDDRKPDAKRNIILVGHDVMTDVKYLRQLGYDPYNLSNLQELIDTSSMYRAFRREQQPRNLGSILADLDIAGWSLHNAGNDSVYTLQAMIGIAVKAILEKPDEKSRDEETKARIAESVKNAADAAWEAQQGWSSEGSDGGAPTGPIGRAPPKVILAVRNRSINSPWRSTRDPAIPYDMPNGGRQGHNDNTGERENRAKFTRFDGAW